MDNWIAILLVALLSVGIIVGLSTLCAVTLLGAGKRYRQKRAEEDSKKILRCLPGTDCGACGYPSCGAFATEVAWQAERLPNCPHLSPEKRDEINEILAEFETLIHQRQEAAKDN